jgi:hypothetical protein
MHSFWSSHEEKRDCVRLSTGGQPWPELELPWELPKLTGKWEGGGGEGGAAWGAAGAPWGGAAMEEGSQPFICSCVLLLSVTWCCT